MPSRTRSRAPAAVPAVAGAPSAWLAARLGACSKRAVETRILRRGTRRTRRRLVCAPRSSGRTRCSPRRAGTHARAPAHATARLTVGARASRPWAARVRRQAARRAARARLAAASRCAGGGASPILWAAVAPSCQQLSPSTAKHGLNTLIVSTMGVLIIAYGRVSAWRRARGRGVTNGARERVHAASGRRQGGRTLTRQDTRPITTALWLRPAPAPAPPAARARARRSRRRSASRSRCAHAR